MRVEFDVATKEHGLRIERVLHTRLADYSRSMLRQLFAAGNVRRNGKRVAKGAVAAAGDRLEVLLPDSLTAAPDFSMALQVVLENEASVVLEKPAGVACAPRHAGEMGTIANALVARYPEMQRVGYRVLEPGLVHRLDNDTSGLLIAARSETAFEELRAGMKQGLLEKSYLAVIAPGELAAEGSISCFVGPDPAHSRRVRVSAHPLLGTSLRTTAYRVVQKGERAWLVELRVTAAYRHQLRAQLAFVGCPLLGDALYGNEQPGLARHALHASRVAWAGGTTVPAFSAVSDLPRELAAFLT
jgi:23S rRNA pseudouridine1911/1915/1917 synthase